MNLLTNILGNCYYCRDNEEPADGARCNDCSILWGCGVDHFRPRVSVQLAILTGILVVLVVAIAVWGPGEW